MCGSVTAPPLNGKRRHVSISKPAAPMAASVSRGVAAAGDPG
jgi:hypothetical protein